MKRMTGIGASEGVSIGKVLLFIAEEIVIPETKTENSTIEAELAKLRDGLKQSKIQLIAIREKVKEKMGEDKAAIFDGHIMLLEDEDLIMEVEDKIKGEGLPAAKALHDGINEYCDMISQLDDPYLRERAADLKDIGKRWLKNLLGMKIHDLSNLEPGTIVVTEDLVNEYIKKQEAIRKEKEELKKLIHEDAVTLDGRKVDIWGNIGSPNDVDAVIESGATGIGLYRTEFLFMNSDHFPTEEEQYQAYRVVAEKMQGKPVTIRTMDIGGDKELPYLDLPKELNPFLGYRAIRISLENKDMFKTQLKAILRASQYGQIKIMYPMISSINEIRKANAILEECKRELDEIGKIYDRNIKVGIMVETPSTAIIAYKFAKEVDFFSIGTNDLTQYFLAVDRGNEMVANLYNSFNPAVLEAIQKVIDAAHGANINVSMCGEFAGDKRATKLLLGMGLDSFSMSASSGLTIKKIIRNSNYADAKKFRDLILQQDTPEDVVEKL